MPYLAGFEISSAPVVLGLVTGMTYGVLAAGLVLVYRSSKIINFGHAYVGVLCAATLGVLVSKSHVPYWLAFAVVLALGAAVGAGSEFLVVRRLRNAPALMSVVATLGLGQFLAFLSVVINKGTSAVRLFPQPSGLPHFQVGALFVTQAHAGMLFITPVVVLALALFLRRSRLGTNILAAAANPDAARLSGVSTSLMSTTSWAISGALAAFTAVLLFPTLGFVTPAILGPHLLVRALAAAVIARLSSLPVALASGVGIGLVEELLRSNYPRGDVVSPALFAVILVVLLLQRRRQGRLAADQSWAMVQPWRPERRRRFRIPQLRLIAVVVPIVFAALVPALVSSASSVVLISIMSFALVGLSVGVIAGLAGQLSLGQFAIAGVGAVASIVVVKETGSFPLGFASAGCLGAATSLLIGLPALRIRGLMLTVTSLAFALATEDWLLKQTWMLGGSGKDPGHPIIGDAVYDSGRRFYLFALVNLLAGLWLARNVWRGGIGRKLRAVRDNEDGARAFAIPATRVKLQAFVFAGFLAGLGGATYAHSLTTVNNATFLVGGSFDAVALTVLGGIGILLAPIIGALYIIGVPDFFKVTDSAELAATSLGWLALILAWPGGIAQAFAPVRAKVLHWITKPEPAEPDAAAAAAVTTMFVPTARTSTGASPGAPLAEVRHLVKGYGGVRAVDDVSLQVADGEIVGLIGANGAGKTTVLELMSGFVRPDHGAVAYAGRDITRMSPEGRARLGLVRSFQDAALFPTLTAHEVAMLSLERAVPTRFYTAVTSGHAAEGRKRREATALLAGLGLADYQLNQVRELSTGTRRILDLACMLALSPRMLLLDEPSSGIAQRETEALGTLLLGLRAEHGIALLVVEHDMPLLFGIADRVIAMETGSIIAEGLPDEVRHNDAVLASYLGGSAVAIERSNSGRRATPSPTRADRCAATTRTGSQCGRAAVVGGLCTQHASAAAVRA